MSPAKPKPPRPVTAWFETKRGKLDAYHAHGVRPAWADEFGMIRCRVTPIRKPTDAEIERLARKLHGAVWTLKWEDRAEIVRVEHRRIARAAWKRGAR